MNTIDKISRDAKLLFVDSMKDAVSSNLVTAAKNGDISLTEDQLRHLINVFSLSVDQTYQKTLPSFQNTIKKYF